MDLRKASSLPISFSTSLSASAARVHLTRSEEAMRTPGPRRLAMRATPRIPALSHAVPAAREQAAQGRAAAAVEAREGLRVPGVLPGLGG
jgi:hypothetical protein